MTALATAGVEPIVRSARPLCAHRVDCRRRYRAVALGRQHARLRDRVVVHGRRDQLAIVRVDGTFVQRLGNALRNSAVELAIDDHWIDHVADVIDGDVSDDLDLARIAIDLDHAHCVPNGNVQFGGS